MATFALAPANYKALNGLWSVPMDHMPEGAAQTFLQGSLLKAVSGLAVEAVTGDHAALLGITQENASGVTNNDTIYVRAIRGVYFEMNLEDRTTPNYALQASDLEAQYAIAVTAGHIVYADHSTTTNPVVTIKSFIGAVGDIRARVLVEFIASNVL